MKFGQKSLATRVATNRSNLKEQQRSSGSHLQQQQIADLTKGRAWSLSPISSENYVRMWISRPRMVGREQKNPTVIMCYHCKTLGSASKSSAGCATRQDEKGA